MDLTKLTARVKLDASDYEIGIGKVKASTVAMGHLMADAIKTAAEYGKGLLKLGMTYNMQMETYTTNFKVMLGTKADAEAKISELKKMAADTPFELEDLADATQELLNFDVAAGKTTTVMTRLGDISLGNAQRFGGLATAYGKVNSQGKLTQETVDMMITNGFNPLLYIVQETGESMTELQERMSKGRVSVDELDLAMRRATSEGGKYYRGMEEGAKTLQGQLSTFSDNAVSILGKAMDPVNEQLSSKILPKAIESLDRLSAALFGVEDDAEAAKKALFFDPEGNPTDPHQNLLTWVDDLMQEWTNGITEDQSVIDQYVGTFKQNTQTMKDALRARINDMANPMTETEIADTERKIAEINAMEDRVEQLLQKRAGGYITDEELNELNTMIATIGALKTEVEAAAAFDENIATPWERMVSAAGDASVDFINKAADFFEWCAGDDGKNGAKVLRVMTTALGALAGMKFGPIGAALGAIAANIDLISAAAEKLYEWIEKLTQWSWNNDAFVVKVPINNNKTVREATTELWDAWSSGEMSTGGSKATAGGSNSGISKDMLAAATGQKHATGLDYVPYNEYPALLHEGEAVLTKLEAQQWRKQDPTAQGAAIDYERLAETIVAAFAGSGIGFSVGGRTLAVATAQDNARAINARQHDINIGRVRL